jgi:hypothetical protein
MYRGAILDTNISIRVNLSMYRRGIIDTDIDIRVNLPMYRGAIMDTTQALLHCTEFTAISNFGSNRPHMLGQSSLDAG